MRVIELFAGAGGAALGMEAAGLEHLACVEKEGDPVETLKAHGFPAIHSRVDGLDYTTYDADLCWASPPCQPFSKVGGRAGSQDDRDGWPDTLRALGQMRPRWFVMENVVGLTLHRVQCEHGCLGPDRCPAAYVDRVIFPDLLSLYDCVDMRILCASWFGVPQKRRRLFVVAGPRVIDWPTRTHGDPAYFDQLDMFSASLLPWATMGSCVDTAEGSPWADGKLGGTEPWRLDQPAPTVSASEWRGSSDVACWKRQRASDALYLATGRPRLTTEEAARLQGFDDGFVHRVAGSRISRDRQIGNAVPPKMAQVVAEAVLLADAQNPRGFVGTDEPRKLRGNAK
tara:strand:+ start:2599 stop:3621 length:1023 start_codon:yes stop_codon:yes gene_type:complete